MAVDPLEQAAPAQQGGSEDADERLAAELAATRGALAETERQLRELRERRSAEMERLERQAYWLEWAGIDFERLMARRRAAHRAEGPATGGTDGGARDPPAAGMSEGEPAPAVSVVVPVKDGARHLAELLESISGQRVDADVEVLVVDSGSSDGSVEIARAHEAQVIEIEPAEFGHGRTRNLAAERTTGDTIVFLTQDATPASTRWLAVSSRHSIRTAAHRPVLRPAPPAARHQPDDRPRADGVLRVLHATKR